MDADEFIINVIAKKNNGTIELSVPDDVFNQAETYSFEKRTRRILQDFPSGILWQ